MLWTTGLFSSDDDDAAAEGVFGKGEEESDEENGKKNSQCHHTLWVHPLTSAAARSRSFIIGFPAVTHATPLLVPLYPSYHEREITRARTHVCVF